MIPEVWIKKEDEKCYQDRLDRLQWLLNITPVSDKWLFHGGWLSKYLFEEARNCFVYGQFIATIVLGFSFIEHSIASILYGSGQNNIRRSRADNLLEEARQQGLLDETEYQRLEHIRKLRNPIVHFRQPGDYERVEYKAVLADDHPYVILENDARYVMSIVLRLITKFSEVI